MKFFIKDFFSKCDRIWSHLLKKSLMENLFFIRCVCELFNKLFIIVSIIIIFNGEIPIKRQWKVVEGIIENKNSRQSCCSSNIFQKQLITYS